MWYFRSRFFAAILQLTPRPRAAAAFNYHGLVINTQLVYTYISRTKAPNAHSWLELRLPVSRVKPIRRVTRPGIFNRWLWIRSHEPERCSKNRDEWEIECWQRHPSLTVNTGGWKGSKRDGQKRENAKEAYLSVFALYRPAISFRTRTGVIRIPIFIYLPTFTIASLPGGSAA